jgi:predicted nuclease of predicted toxin-antitoxin system
MKLLLDECVPQRLKHDFPEHNVSTVAELGLCGVKNGELLRAAAEDFDVLITVDRGMPLQQNLAKFDLALIILIAKPCRYPQLKSLVPRVLSALDQIESGDVVEIPG